MPFFALAFLFPNVLKICAFKSSGGILFYFHCVEHQDYYAFGLIFLFVFVVVVVFFPFLMPCTLIWSHAYRSELMFYY